MEAAAVVEANVRLEALWIRPLRHLPETPVPPAYSSVALVGPGCSTPVDTEYYQRKVRGRGAGRRAHDLVLQFSNGAVRLQPDWSQRTRVDRHGLWIKPGRILGVTARSLREAIERTQQIHLCRSEDCLQEGELHCKAYAAIDADEVIDLGVYGRLNSWRMLVLCCRGTKAGVSAARQIQDQGVARVLDPDSESEAEVSDPCEAVLVGLELQRKPRALAPEGCEDRGATEPTRLLDDDLQLGGKECARLCNHHSQARKCSVVSCFSKVYGAHRGTPLCKKHLSETGAPWGSGRYF